MPERALRPCRHPGCCELTRSKSGYCAAHEGEYQLRQKAAARRYEKSRGGSTKQGYTYRWQQYSKRYIRAHPLCVLHLDGCTELTECVDHIDPPDGPGDPSFWDPRNHQPGCIHCNSVKGHRCMRGTYDPLAEMENLQAMTHEEHDRIGRLGRGL
jgi:5-methylcytosine-specific restriction protein A